MYIRLILIVRPFLFVVLGFMKTCLLYALSVGLWIFRNFLYVSNLGGLKGYQ